MAYNLPSALITGGAQGIGKALAQEFLGAGYGVVLLDHNSQGPEAATEELSPLGPMEAILGDVARQEDVQQAIAKAANRFGQLNTIIANAGLSQLGTALTELPLEQWRRIIDVNLGGCFLCAKHGAPYLQQSQGSLITIASTRALQSEPDSEAYAASKGGIVALTHALAVSLGPAVRVNCISPGWIETSAWQQQSQRQNPQLTPEDHAQHPAGRVGTPQDVAALALYLASPEAGFITGQNFVVDGGMTRKMIYAE